MERRNYATFATPIRLVTRLRCPSNNFLKRGAPDTDPRESRASSRQRRTSLPASGEARRGRNTSKCSAESAIHSSVTGEISVPGRNCAPRSNLQPPQRKPDAWKSVSHRRAQSRAPPAHLHKSLGQRPRNSDAFKLSAEGTIHGCIADSITPSLVS